MKMQLSKLALPIGRVAGFTMIELLIVITILGILAVAVLSAINPIEQINRGRDTGTQSDAEQMINAIERYNAFQGKYPWKKESTGSFAISTFTTIDSSWRDDSSPTNCSVLEKLSVVASTGSTCYPGTDELKQTFVSRINSSDRKMFVYNRGQLGDSTYVCFLPQSKAFSEQAKTRCGTGGADLPADMAGIKTTVCPTSGDAFYVCLP